MFGTNIYSVSSYRAINISGVEVISNGIEKMEDAPCGGYIVTILDAEGFPLNLVWGQSPAEPLSMPERLDFNDEQEKPRVRKFVRFTPGPAAIYKVSGILCLLEYTARITNPAVHAARALRSGS